MVYLAGQTKTAGGVCYPPPACTQGRVIPVGTREAYPFVPKTCEVCGESMALRRGESRRMYAVRRTCGQKCAGAIRGPLLRAKTGVRTCAECGSAFERRPGERADHFNQRAACSPDCARAVGARTNRDRFQETKPCSVCGVLMERRDGEKPALYRRRATCSEPCRREQIWRVRLGQGRRHTPYPPEWTPRLRAEIKARDNDQCRLCGEGGRAAKLAVHHVNYQKADCRPENLVTLCARCHAQTNYGDRAQWMARLGSSGE